MTERTVMDVHVVAVLDGEEMRAVGGAVAGEAHTALVVLARDSGRKASGDQSQAMQHDRLVGLQVHDRRAALAVDAHAGFAEHAQTLAIDRELVVGARPDAQHGAVGYRGDGRRNVDEVRAGSVGGVDDERLGGDCDGERRCDEEAREHGRYGNEEGQSQQGLRRGAARRVPTAAAGRQGYAAAPGGPLRQEAVLRVPGAHGTQHAGVVADLCVRVARVDE